MFCEGFVEDRVTVGFGRTDFDRGGNGRKEKVAFVEELQVVVSSTNQGLVVYCFSTLLYQHSVVLRCRHGGDKIVGKGSADASDARPAKVATPKKSTAGLMHLHSPRAS